jgi:hypothetical protein
MLKVIVLLGSCVLSAFAQTTAPSNDVVVQSRAVKISSEASFGPIGITAALAGPMTTIPGAPYSAEAVTQRVQILADGNRISQTTTNNVARDSAGRVRREESLPGLAGSNSEPPRLVLIEDPVAGLHITLDSNSKTAIKIATGQRKKTDEAAMRNGIPPVTSNQIWFTTADPGPQLHTSSVEMKSLTEEKSNKTDLGTQTMEGIVAKGTKITHTIAAGDIGNDLPLVITTETWYSPDLKVLVMSKSSDPRMGETTYKLTNLSRTEPDPGLFQIPADYTIKEQPGADVFVYKKVDK